MPFYTYDHIHLLSQEPMETARYFNRMFGARIVESVQSDGQPRVDLDGSVAVAGLSIRIPSPKRIAPAAAGLRRSSRD